jgi:hypothetical protein
MDGVKQVFLKKQHAHQAHINKPLIPQTYDDALDQWVVDEPKVHLYEDFL